MQGRQGLGEGRPERRGKDSTYHGKGRKAYGTLWIERASLRRRSEKEGKGDETRPTEGFDFVSIVRKKIGKRGNRPHEGEKDRTSNFWKNGGYSLA